jgi:hypothetical protein
MSYGQAVVDAPTTLKCTNKHWTPVDAAELNTNLLHDTEKMRYLNDVRGVSRQTVKDFNVGLYKGTTFTFPVYDFEKNLLNMRFWSPEHKKKWGLAGKTTKMIYPHHLLNGSDHLWLCEGELDAMVAHQNGMPVLTTTAGAPATPATLKDHKKHLEGYNFILAFDNDDAGKKAAAKIGLEVFPNRISGIVVWPPGFPKGYDLSDWFSDGNTLDQLNDLHVKEFCPEHAKSLVGSGPPTLFEKLPANAVHTAPPVVAKTPDETFDLETMWPNKGFLRNYVNYASTLTDAPNQFHCATALTIMGTATERRVWHWMGGDKIRPNFYTCIVAPSSVFRKTTAIRIGMRLLTHYKRSLILPREFSTEALVNQLSETSKGLFAYSEMAELLDQFERGYSKGIMALLTDFYDCPDLYERRTQTHGNKSIKHPFLSILGASTVDWLNQNLTQEQAEGGFWPRFLFFSAREKIKNLIQFPPAPNKNAFDSLSIDLKSCAWLEGEMKMMKSARTLIEEWTAGHHESANHEVLGTTFLKFATRMQPYALKIAMLYELSLTKSLLISDVAMKYALRMCDWLLHNLEHLFMYEFAYHKRDARDLQLLSYVRKKPEGVSYRDISRRFRLNEKEIKESLGTLQLREWVTVHPIDGVFKAFPLTVATQFGSI